MAKRISTIFFALIVAIFCITACVSHKTDSSSDENDTSYSTETDSSDINETSDFGGKKDGENDVSWEDRD